MDHFTSETLFFMYYPCFINIGAFKDIDNTFYENF